jgi:hypothetical protein
MTMAPRRRTLAGFIILALAVLPRVAHAQAASPDGRQGWPTVDALAPSTKIVVTLKTGETWVGDFRRTSAADVTIAVRPKGQQPAKEETLPKSLIATVATAPDPVWNGALLGAGIGTGLAIWDYLIDPSEPGNAAIFTVAIGLGTAIGAGIDALVNRRGKVLYAASGQTASITVSPSLAKDRRGMFVSIRF